MSNFVVLLGPPGAGKGTQAQIVSDKLGLPHISSGDIFRENFKNKTELGKLADGYIKRGELVPDEITIAMIQERLSRSDCEPGALLDGFPRTPAQAEALEGFLVSLGGRIVAVLYIKVSDNLLIDRLAGRWTCRAKGHIFHEKNYPPKNPGRCDIDGSELYQRDDDKAETVARRIRVYFEQTQALIDHYKQRGLLVEVDGSLPIEEVTAGLLAALAVVR